MRQGLACRPDRGEQVLVEGMLPVVLVQRLERAGGRATCVVDDDVEAAQRFDRRAHGGLDVVMARHVADERHDLHLGARLIPDIVSGLVERLLVARAERDARPLAGESERDRAPDPAARAPDQRRLPFEAGVHGRIVEEPGARSKKEAALPGD